MNRLLPGILWLLTALSIQPAHGQIVGFANVSLYPGENLIANQFVQGDNSLNTALVNGTAAGSTFTMWDPLASSFLPLSVYNGTSWSLNYTFDIGRGGLLDSPVMATNTFAGGVIIYTNVIPDPFLSGIRWHPNYPNGLYLLSIPDAISATGDTLFRDVTDRSPLDGEWVRTLDPITQSYRTTTYHSGSGWDNGDPSLAYGQAAWFDLGPVAVPEPGVIAFFSIGATCWWRRRKKGR